MLHIFQLQKTKEKKIDSVVEWHIWIYLLCSLTLLPNFTYLVRMNLRRAAIYPIDCSIYPRECNKIRVLNVYICVIFSLFTSDAKIIWCYKKNLLFLTAKPRRPFSIFCMQFRTVFAVVRRVVSIWLRADVVETHLTPHTRTHNQQSQRRRPSIGRETIQYKRMENDDG